MKAVINDLPAVQEAAEAMGATVLVNEKARGWSVGRSDKQADLVLRIPDCRFDVAVVRNEDGSYRMEGDLFNGALEKFFGKNFDKLGERYQIARLQRVARKKRMSTRVKENKGHLVLEVLA
jgi:hypothetical protein